MTPRRCLLLNKYLLNEWMRFHLSNSYPSCKKPALFPEASLTSLSPWLVWLLCSSFTALHHAASNYYLHTDLSPPLDSKLLGGKDLAYVTLHPSLQLPVQALSLTCDQCLRNIYWLHYWAELNDLTSRKHTPPPLGWWGHAAPGRQKQPRDHTEASHAPWTGLLCKCMC